MKLVHPLLEQKIEFVENQINVLCIENQKEFVKTILDIQAQIQGFDMGELVLSDSKIIDFKNNVELVTDLFNLDFNSKKISTKLNQVLCDNAIDELFFLKTLEISKNIEEYINDLIFESNYDLIYSTKIDASAIIKMAGVSINLEDNENLVARLINYIDLHKNLLNTKLFVFVNLKSFLNPIELELFYKEVFYRKINILLLENFCKCDIIKVKSEKLYLLDNDLCEI